MKKTLATLLALVFVLGIAGTALAAPANPFVDVPSKHWAYGAVAKLAKAGIVDGYGDGTFRGDKTMTRYEMAQIVAKAMAKSDKADAENKALIDKLAVEFAAELNNLGVRVAKLEKNASNIKLSADYRLRWVNTDKGNNPNLAQRFRLIAQADINDTVSFYARTQILNHNEMGTYNNTTQWDGTTSKGGVNEVTDAYVNVKRILPNVDLKAGRYTLPLGETTYYSGTTGGFDGVEATWKSGKATLMGGYVDPGMLFDYKYGSTSLANNKYGNLYYSQLAYKFNDAFKMSAFYEKNQDKGTIKDLINTYGVGFTYGTKWRVVSEYWKNNAEDAKNADSNPDGQIYRLQYGMVNPAVPGTWHAWVEWMNLDKGVNESTFTGSNITVSDIKAWDVQYSYTFAKNVFLEAFYQFDMKKNSTNADYFTGGGNTYTRVQVNFLF